MSGSCILYQHNCPQGQGLYERGCWGCIFPTPLHPTPRPNGAWSNLSADLAINFSKEFKNRILP
ncbi:hypothetical protein [Nostoc sp. FACHB-110]|uniref:hypothetical protein n=1 Tax=Nostoc sp. FACHB-110 TaxID=2692834 RepID=UPI001684F1AD|nr:hypothetical protein [Nostoc sp. FACHB-110]MBD2437283.1 hypothetical protein [Nostoc sp. FACHB-110]